MADPRLTNPFLFSNEQRRQEGGAQTTPIQFRGMRTESPFGPGPSPRTIPRNNPLRQGPVHQNNVYSVPQNTVVYPNQHPNFNVGQQAGVPRLADFEAVPFDETDAVAWQFNHWEWILDNRISTNMPPPWTVLRPIYNYQSRPHQVPQQSGMPLLNSCAPQHIQHHQQRQYAREPVPSIVYHADYVDKGMDRYHAQMHARRAVIRAQDYVHRAAIGPQNNGNASSAYNIEHPTAHFDPNRSMHAEESFTEFLEDNV